MNNEIKEIEHIMICLKEHIALSNDEDTYLLDYITNLQQENEYLKLSNPEMNIEHFRIINENKRKIDNLRKQNKELQQENERLNKEINNKEFVFVGTAQNKTRDFIKQLIREKNDYKSRCGKGIEYIKNCEIIDKDKRYPLLEEQFGEDLLNILQNGSDNNVK